MNDTELVLLPMAMPIWNYNVYERASGASHSICLTKSIQVCISVFTTVYVCRIMLFPTTKFCPSTFFSFRIILPYRHKRCVCVNIHVEQVNSEHRSTYTQSTLKWDRQWDTNGWNGMKWIILWNTQKEHNPLKYIHFRLNHFNSAAVIPIFLLSSVLLAYLFLPFVCQMVVYCGAIRKATTIPTENVCVCVRTRLRLSQYKNRFCWNITRCTVQCTVYTRIMSIQPNDVCVCRNEKRLLNYTDVEKYSQFSRKFCIAIFFGSRHSISVVMVNCVNGIFAGMLRHYREMMQLPGMPSRLYGIYHFIAFICPFSHLLLSKFIAILFGQFF